MAAVSSSSISPFWAFVECLRLTEVSSKALGDIDESGVPTSTANVVPEPAGVFLLKRTIFPFLLVPLRGEVCVACETFSVVSASGIN